MNTVNTQSSVCPAFLTVFASTPQPDAERIGNFGRKLRKLLSAYPYLEFRLAHFSFLQYMMNADGSCALFALTRRQQIDAVLAGLRASQLTRYDQFLLRTLEQTELPSPARSKEQPE